MRRHSADKTSDIALIALCNGGDAKTAATAFDALYRRHRDYVVRVALRFVRQREPALDVLQSTFLYLLHRFPPLGEGLKLSGKLTSLLYPVAKNHAIDLLRKAEREGNAGLDPDALADATSAPDGDVLDLALASLTQERREVLVLRFVDGMSLQEIAHALEIPVGTVKSRLHLAIKALRNLPAIRELWQ